MITPMFKYKLRFLVITMTVLIGFAVAAFADEQPTMESLQAAIDQKGVVLDNIWTLLTAVLVFFMQAGFALVETGFTRAKNACNILMKNLMDF